MKKEIQLKQIIDILEELDLYQQKNLMKIAQDLISNITEEDILQPNDYTLLEYNPLFRYEEGVLHGIKSAIAAIKTSDDGISE